MRRHGKMLAISCGTVLTILLLALLVLPGVIRNALIENLTTLTGRTATLQAVSINPLTLSAELRGFQLAEPGGAPVFASFSSARISVSPASLFRKAVIVSALELRAPYLKIVRAAENRYNFSDLLKAKKTGVEKNSRPLLFSLNNIELKNGSIDFIDEALPRTSRHSVRELTVAIPFASNIPYLADRYVSPQLSASIDGTPFAVNGRLKPIARSMESSLHIDLKGLDLHRYIGYLPGDAPLKIDRGYLSTSLDLSYRISAAERPELDLSGSASLEQLSLQTKGGSPLLSLANGSIRIGKASLFSRSFDIANIALNGPELHLERDAAGKFNLRSLFAGDRRKTDQPSPGGKRPRPNLNLAALQVSNGRILFADLQPSYGRFSSTLEEIALDLKGLSTQQNAKGRWNASLRSTAGEQFSSDGEIILEPLSVAGRLALSGIRPALYQPYLADYLTSGIGGTVDASTSFSFMAGDGLKLSDFSLTGHDLKAAFTRTDGITIRNLLISGGYLDTARRQTGIERIGIRGGSVRLTRESDGRLSGLGLLRQAPRSSSANPPETTSAPRPFGYRVGTASVSDISAHFIDLATNSEEIPELRLSRVNISLSGIKGPEPAPTAFSLSALYGRNGRIASSGSILPKPFRLKSDLKLERIPLQDFNPYLPENLNIYLADGTMDARARLDLASGPKGVTGTYSGDLGIRSFYCMDTVEDEELLKWESLQFDDVSGSISPFGLIIRQVALNSMYARILINRDGTLNLQQLKGEGRTVAAASPAPQAPSPPPAQGPSEARRKIRIDTITIQDGTINFDDRHLPNEFAATFYNLGGRVAGISTDETRPAEVDLRGNLENHSPLRITGTLNPLWANPFVDLKVSFTDIDLSPFTPYSGTYLGYSVDKGKLFLDLKYRVENRALNSENRIFIDQFTLGERVESQKATSLPIRLAISLLKDRKGEIHLDLPVTGRTDDPEFSVWNVVLKMLKNLLEKAATSPFSLLASLMEGGEELTAITFTPGSSRINPGDQAKLVKFAGALLERPGIKIDLTGHVDRDRDREGYRIEQLTRKMKTEKFLVLSKARLNLPGQTPDALEILPEEQGIYLKAVYAKEKFPKPRTMLGLVKDLPDNEMRKLILANTTAGDEQMLALAREREAAVRDFLIHQGKVPGERLFMKSGDIFRSSEKPEIANSRVEFGVGVR